MEASTPRAAGGAASTSYVEQLAAAGRETLTRCSKLPAALAVPRPSGESVRGGYIEDISSQSQRSASTDLAPSGPGAENANVRSTRTRSVRLDVYYQDGAGATSGQGDDEEEEESESPPPKKRRRELRTTKTNHITAPQYKCTLEGDGHLLAPPAAVAVADYQRLRPPPAATTSLEEKQYLTRIAQVPFADLAFGSLLGSGFFGKVYKGAPVGRASASSHIRSDQVAHLAHALRTHGCRSIVESGGGDQADDAARVQTQQRSAALHQRDVRVLVR
jgi:hypothetical protein